MAYIKELMESLFEQQSEGNIESFKKLIYLAVNESKVFAPYALQLANMICPILHCIEDNTTKIYTLQLLSELATNYKDEIPAATYDFPQVIAMLSDQNAEVRKASHYLLLIFIKKYQRIDEIVKGYATKLRENPDQWKQIQKIIHSFQSLLVIEPRCITYPENYSHLDQFMRIVIAFRVHQHQLIQKASQQTVASFVKNQYTPKIVNKLSKVITAELSQIAEKLGINLQIKPSASTTELYKTESKKEARKLNEIEVLLEAIQQQTDWKVKSEIIEEISKKLQAENRLQIPQELVERMLDFTYDCNFKICITAMNILLTLITNYSAVCEKKSRKIEDIMIDKICDLKMAVRQIASKILKKIFSNSSKDSAKRVFGRLANCSVVGKQEILNFIQQYYTTVIPSDLALVLSEVANQLSNENTKIKIKTLDCLVKISLNCNIDQCKYILQKKLNKVYYDMFLDRLKERGPEVKLEKWDDAKNNNLNKGMTWQAERSPHLAEPGYDKNLTKVEFSKKSERIPQEDTMYDFKFEAPTFGGAEKREQGKSKGIMMGTSHTSNETYSSYEAKIDDSVNSKFSKKTVAESYRPSGLSNFQTVEEKIAAQEKKLPLKPKPVKKITTEVPSEQGDRLVIQSKEYQNKNTYQQIKEEKPVNKMKLTRNRQQKVEKQKQMEEQKNFEKSNKEPFSIKKSTSKKDHQLDYKATQYVSKEELAPFSNPKEMLREITANLPKDSDWSKQFDSLDGLRRLIKNHEDIFPLIQQNLPGIMPEVLKLVESLRSSLAKNGMITLAQMCEAFKKSMDPFLQGIFVKLFKKAQDANTFIIEQVNKCIKSLCKYCTSNKITTIVINNSQAKAIPIKLKVAYCIDKLFEKDNYSLNLLKENPKILGVMGNYITDSSQEVRGLTKELFINMLNNNSLNEVETIFRKSPKDVWDKWRSIIDRDLK